MKSLTAENPTCTKCRTYLLLGVHQSGKRIAECVTCGRSWIWIESVKRWASR